MNIADELFGMTKKGKNGNKERDNNSRVAEFLETYHELCDYRNDVNHALGEKQTLTPELLDKKLKAFVKEYEAMLRDKIRIDYSRQRPLKDKPAPSIDMDFQKNW